MNFIKKYFIRKKWGFLRKANTARRRLEGYACLEIPDLPIDRLPLCCEFAYVSNAKTCKSIAILFGCPNVRDARSAYCGGLEEAAKVLEDLEKINERYCFLE